MVNLKNEKAFQNVRLLKKGELTSNARWLMNILMIIFLLSGLDLVRQSAELGSVSLLVASVVIMLLAMAGLFYINTGRRAGKDTK